MVGVKAAAAAPHLVHRGCGCTVACGLQPGNVVWPSIPIEAPVEGCAPLSMVCLDGVRRGLKPQAQPPSAVTPFNDEPETFDPSFPPAGAALRVEIGLLSIINFSTSSGWSEQGLHLGCACFSSLLGPFPPSVWVTAMVDHHLNDLSMFETGLKVGSPRWEMPSPNSAPSNPETQNIYWLKDHGCAGIHRRSAVTFRHGGPDLSRSRLYLGKNRPSLKHGLKDQIIHCHRGLIVTPNGANQGKQFAHFRS